MGPGTCGSGIQAAERKGCAFAVEVKSTVGGSRMGIASLKFVYGGWQEEVCHQWWLPSEFACVDCNCCKYNLSFIWLIVIFLVLAFMS